MRSNGSGAVRFYDSLRLYHQISVLKHFNKVQEKPFIINWMHFFEMILIPYISKERTIMFYAFVFQCIWF